MDTSIGTDVYIDTYMDTSIGAYGCVHIGVYIDKGTSMDTCIH